MAKGPLKPPRLLPPYRDAPGRGVARLWFFAGQKGPGLFTGLPPRALPKTAAARLFSHGGCRTAAKGSARSGFSPNACFQLLYRS